MRYEMRRDMRAKARELTMSDVVLAIDLVKTREIEDEIVQLRDNDAQPEDGKAQLENENARLKARVSELEAHDAALTLTGMSSSPKRKDEVGDEWECRERTSCLHTIRRQSDVSSHYVQRGTGAKF